MKITRTFLDWHQPALPAVITYLAQRFQQQQTLDLQQVILVLPGGRAGRRLTELLVDYSDEHHLLLRPPTYCTVGNLPEQLYESLRPFAGELTQQLAWVRALQHADSQKCRQFFPRLPADDDHAGWMDLGALLQRQHRELAADALDFSHVAQRGRQLAGFEETDRWRFLRQVQQQYLQILDQLGLWDRQTARLYAIDHRLCRSDRHIVLIGTTDMNIAMRRMLDQVAEQVTALIHAPADLADRFDVHGCLIPEKWQEAPIPIATEQMHVVEGPDEQAREVVRCLAAFQGHYRADQAVIGVLDEALVPELLRQLHESSVPARWVVGRTLRDTAPFRLLEAAARFARRGRFADFAALVRHADVSQWLTDRVTTDNWLTELDDYYNQHLPPQLDSWLDDAPPPAALRQVVSLIHEAMSPLQGAQRNLLQWAPVIADLLAFFYGERMFDVDQPGDYYTLRALEQLRTCLLQFEEVPEDIAPALSATQAIEQLLGNVSGAQIPSPHAANQLQLLGWLELPLDTAPALILTGFNEGNVPTSLNSDLFLPNQLRQQLDLLDNRRRYARDAYALSSLQASRDHLTLIAGRRSANHDPLAPSRLALATDDATIAERALAFYASSDETLPEQGAAEPAPTTSPDQPEDPGHIVVPQPQPHEPITSIRVTAFRTYIECPYRFYLQQVLQLEGIDDLAEELSAAAFGTLLHEVLSQFGNDPVNRSTDPEKITQFLDKTLDACVASQYGAVHFPSLEVQVVQARRRLEAFAQWQAERARQGWEIAYSETSGGDEPARLHLPSGTSIELKGRIDRIDRCEDRWQILDYKTGDTGHSPEETHRNRTEWLDLQLPLYLHLAATLNIEGSTQLGYILLPKDTAKAGLALADWDDATLASADEAAMQIAEDIVAQRFWPPRQLRSGRHSPYAPICQEDAFRAQLEVGQ